MRGSGRARTSQTIGWTADLLRQQVISGEKLVGYRSEKSNNDQTLPLQLSVTLLTDSDEGILLL